MDHSDPQEVHAFIRKSLIVFAILLVLTVLTVAASRVDMGGTMNIVVALIIACVKASLVGAFFMHLISEKQLIYSVLYICAAFIVVMFGLILFHNANGIVL